MKQKELKALLDDMSLDEKIGQLVQLSGEFYKLMIFLTVLEKS